MLPQLVDAFLSAYGRFVPYHPGRWRISHALEPLAAPTWNGPRVIERRGIRYQVDMRDFVPRAICYDGVYEWSETRFVEGMVKPSYVCFDLGTHIGYFSLLLSKLVGDQGRVFSVEASPTTFARLQRNLALNSCRNVTAVNRAIGDHMGFVGINTVDGNTGSSSITDSGDVPMTTLDALVRDSKVDRIDFIKCDIEGAEMAFLRGATGALQRFRPTLLMELNANALAQFGTTPQRVVDHLHSLNYRLFRPTWKGLNELSSLPGEDEYFNIVALPQ